MTTRQSLSNDLERTSHNVGTFDSDGNGDGHVAVAHVVLVTSANGRSGSDVHAMLDNATTTFGNVLFHDGGNDHGSLMIVDNAVHQVTTGNRDQTVASSLAESFLDSTKLGDGHTELLAHSGISTDRRSNTSSGSKRTSRQTHSTSFGQTLNKHVPPIAASLLSSKNHVHGNPNVLTFNCTIHKSSVERHVAGTHVETRMVAFQESDRESLFPFAFQKPIRVGQVESETHHTSNRSQCDVSLLEISHDPNFSVAFLYYTVTTDQGSCITSRMRSGETKAGDERTVGKTG
mmetsp:Transcript_6086/g.8721  ORF Transcript_6086/g.8721 Transcript_6086/m.8721 type:complete len:289 (-) Transcript_6086:639-1505(-)